MMKKPLKTLMIKEATMMKKPLKTLMMIMLVCVPAVILTTEPVAAQSLSEVDSYMRTLRRRIDRGEQNGKLTRKETSNLNAMYRIVETARDKYDDDGRVSRDERKRLMKSLTALDKAIWDQLRDDEVARWRDWDDDRGEWRRQQRWDDSPRASGSSRGSGSSHGIASLSEIDSYMRTLRRRIDRGERNGKLTSKEASKLNSLYRLVKTARDRYDDDGRVSRDERKRLMDSLTALDKAIWNDLRDDDVARWRDWDDHKGEWRRSQRWGD